MHNLLKKNYLIFVPLIIIRITKIPQRMTNTYSDISAAVVFTIGLTFYLNNYTDCNLRKIPRRLSYKVYTSENYLYPPTYTLPLYLLHSYLTRFTS